MTRRMRIGVLIGVALLVALTMVPAVTQAAGGDDHSRVKPAGIAPAAQVPKDAYEPDDTPSQAKPLKMPFSEHTSHYVANDNDVDWVYFSVAATGTPVLLETQTPLKPDSWMDQYINVYDEAGSLVASETYVFGDGNCAYTDDKLAGCQDAALAFVTPHPGKFFVRIESDDVGSGGPFNGNQFGYYRLYANIGIGRRVSGPNRYEGAVALSKMQFADANSGYMMRFSTMGIVIANGNSMADIAEASLLAANTGSPLFLAVTPDYVTPSTRREIARISQAAFSYVGADAIRPSFAGPGGPTPPEFPKLPLYVVGGKTQVSDALAASLVAGPYMSKVERIAGANRYATAAAVMDKIMSFHMVTAGLPGPGPSPSDSSTIFVVAGDATADMVSAAPMASANCSPLLLTGKSSVPASTTAWINTFGAMYDQIVVVGGTATIDDAVLAQLGALKPTYRVAGSTRYTTNKALIDWMLVKGKHAINTSRMILVSGNAPADALMVTGLSYQMQSAPVLLTRSDLLSPTVKQYMDQQGPQFLGSYLIGGPVSVSDSTLFQWNHYGWPFAPGEIPPPFAYQGFII